MIFRYLKYVFFLFILAVTVHGVLLTSSCARIGHPSGGPKDTLAPVLIRAQPAQGALFFDKKKISISFNEFVQLKDAEKQFIMSPPPEKRPTLSVKGKSVEVTFNSPLKENTTYQLDFGTSIVDNNEGNPYEPYRLAFSTGATFDTLSVSGRVLDAYDDQPLPNALVYLYEDLSDSVVLKVRPNSVTRSDEHGEFLAENLKSEPYKIVVLNDANKNYKYDIGQEAIGFLDLPVEPVAVDEAHGHSHKDKNDKNHKHDDADDGKLVLRMFTEDVFTQYITSCQQLEKRALKMTFNAPQAKIDSFAIQGMDVSKFVVEASPRHDTLVYWFADTSAYIPDTINLSFTYLKTDTLGGLSPSREKRRFTFEEKVKEEKDSKPSGLGGLFSRLVGTEEKVDSTPKKPAHWTLQPQLKTSSVGPIEPLSVDFGALLISVNPQLIKFEELRINPRTKDSSYVELKYELLRDSIRLRHYRLPAEWKENTYYRYTMLPNAFVDIYSQTNDTIKGGFSTVAPDKLSNLIIDFTSVEGWYLVQLTDVKGKKIIREHRINANTKLDIKYVTPGAYGIRVVKDDNGNGKWDTGSYFKHVQPEYATMLKASDGKLEFALRQGWDVEVSVDMSVLFPEK